MVGPCRNLYSYLFALSLLGWNIPICIFLVLLTGDRNTVSTNTMGSTGLTMKAAQWDPKQNRAVVNTLPVPEPGPNQILIKMASASLCHSDLMAISRPGLTEPFTVGHEGAGYVYQLGRDCQEKGFRIGDPVGFLYINGCCFECEGCMVHNTHCTNGNPVVAGFGGIGFFQEYAPVDWQNVIHLPPALPPQRASAIFCAGITGMLQTMPFQ